MATFTGFDWTADNTDHIARHQVTPEEVEEACYNLAPAPWITQGRGSRRRETRRLYYVLGQTEAGRYLFVVLRAGLSGRAYTITARDITPAERRLYERNRADG